MERVKGGIWKEHVGGLNGGCLGEWCGREELAGKHEGESIHWHRLSEAFSAIVVGI